MSSLKRQTVRNFVEIQTPATTANMGPGFDRLGVALNRPTLTTILSPRDGNKVVMAYNGTSRTPDGRERGHAGLVALQCYLEKIGIQNQGLELVFKEEEDGFPTGGTGSSAAEAVGAVLASAVLFDKELSPTDAILAAAKGEPAEHMDNVAPAVMGGIVLMDKKSDGKVKFTRIEPPENLNMAIGFSSHQKTEGTEGTRNILMPLIGDSASQQAEFERLELASLKSGNISDFLSVVWQDKYHELPRADAGFYGNFNAEQFKSLKVGLYKNHGIGLSVSGAGPSMALWFDETKYPGGLKDSIKKEISAWFSDHGIAMSIEDNGISTKGAYEYAIRKYSDSALARLSAL